MSFSFGNSANWMVPAPYYHPKGSSQKVVVRSDSKDCEIFTTANYHGLWQEPIKPTECIRKFCQSDPHILRDVKCSSAIKTFPPPFTTRGTKTLLFSPSSQGHHDKKLKTVSSCFFPMHLLGFVYCWPIIATDHHLHYSPYNHRAFISHRHFMKNYSAPLMTVCSAPCSI